MVRYITLVILSSLSVLSAQYILKSPYLIQPEKVYGYMDSSANFWQKSWDSSKGGFYTKVDREGNVGGSHKNMITQSRNAYGLVRTYMLTGKKFYLDRAKQALDFMVNSAWDEDYDGWYEFVDENGHSYNTDWDKTAFFQHYALLGLVAYWEATGDSIIWQWIEKSYNSNESHLWDDDETEFGYFDNGKTDWSSSHDKSFNATVDAITTHLENLYLLTYDDKYLTRLHEIGQNILDHLVPSMDTQAIGFAEKYTDSWAIKSNETQTIMGHVLKTAWCLGRIYQIDPNPDYLDAAEELISDVLDNGGYDHYFGGPYKDFNRVNGEMLMWGIADTAKAWWQMEQAVTAGLMMYDITNEDKYLKMADESLDFFMTWFVDHQYGEVYENRERSGKYITEWGSTKGSEYKAGYHSMETGYYVYLYGNLYVHHQPVRLNYNFDAYNFDRSIAINPIPWSNPLFSIDSVYKDGSVYADFDAANRQLNLPAETSGHFTVVLTPGPSTAIAQNRDKDIPDDFELEGNYPNPFNPSTTIKINLPQTGKIKVEIFNISGQKILVLLDNVISAGEQHIKWNAAGMASGTYFYRVTGANSEKNGKMLLLK